MLKCVFLVAGSKLSVSNLADCSVGTKLSEAINCPGCHGCQAHTQRPFIRGSAHRSALRVLGAQHKHHPVPTGSRKDVV